MAYYRTNRADDATASMRQMRDLYATQWKLDNPLTKFGLDTYQKHPTMVTIDAFGKHEGGAEELLADDDVLVRRHRSTTTRKGTKEPRAVDLSGMGIQ